MIIPTGNSNTSTPTITRELMEYLEKHYPERCPSPTDSEREIWMYAGQGSAQYAEPFKEFFHGKFSFID